MEHYRMLEYKPDMESDLFKQQSLELLAARLTDTTYKDYPAQADRLVLSWLDVSYSGDGKLVLPDGPWTIIDAPNKTAAGLLPTLAQQAEFERARLQLDSLGRPLHPWALDMLKNPRIGGVLNRGFYYNWGPNYTADTVVLNTTNDSVLLIKRQDTGQWALPGGFIDTNESSEAAARREVTEETGIILPNSAQLQLTYKGPVADIRSTIHAWAETSCFVTTVVSDLPCQGADDALEAAWMPVNDAITKSVFGSHKLLIQSALKIINKTI